MSEYGYIKRSTFGRIANALRVRTGSTDLYKPSEMADAIRAITTLLDVESPDISSDLEGWTVTKISTLEDIADAIREFGNSNDTYTPYEMAYAILEFAQIRLKLYLEFEGLTASADTRIRSAISETLTAGGTIGGISAAADLVAEQIKLLLAEAKVPLAADAPAGLLPAAALNFEGTEEYGTLSDDLSVAQAVHGGADAVDVMKSADDLSAAYAAHGNAKANEEAQVSDNISAAQVLDCPAVSMDENVMSAPDISSAITTPASADGVVKKIAAMSDTGLTAARPGKIASSGTTDLSAESAGKTAGLVFASGKISAGVHTSAAMKAETSEAESSLWAESYGSVLHIYRVYRADQDGTVLYIDKDDDAEDAWAVSDGSTLVITQAYAAAQDGTQLGIE